jgi:predicted DNA-binding transcriptional regulator AlpA
VPLHIEEVLKAKKWITGPMSSKSTDLINISAFARAIAQELRGTLEQTTSRRVFNLDAAAEYCGLTRNSFKKKVIRDQVRKVRLDKCWRFDKTDLDAWIESHKEQMAQETAA